MDPKGAEKVVLFVFDGLGSNEWARHNDGGFFGALTRRGNVCPITSVFPSTTAAALTSLGTGLTTQEHSLVEWYLYLAELGIIVESLPFTPMGGRRTDEWASTADPSILFTGETIYAKMKEQGVASYSFIHRAIAFSGYSKAAQRESEVRPFVSSSDLCVSLRRAVEEAKGPSFFYVYYSMIDTVEHVYGPNTEEAFLTAQEISDSLMKGFAERLSPTAAQKTLLLATADHGQIYSPPEKTLMFDDHDPLFENFAVDAKGNKILPWGSPRDVYLQLREGTVGETEDFLKRTLGGAATVIRTADAIEAGLFGRGTPSRAFLDRVGNLMILPTGTGSVWYRHPGVREPDMVGRHGGLHRDEMTIPFAAARASSLAVR